MIDLEFVGDIQRGVNHCRIYEIAGVTNTGDTFQTYVDPYPETHILPKPVHPGCFHLTRDFIQSNNIQPISHALARFIRFINNIAADNITIFAHAAFRSDKPILMNAIRRTGLVWPTHARFADTLNIVRAAYPNIGKYDLASVYCYIFGSTMPRPHSALHDAKALDDILTAIPNHWEFTVTYAIDQYPLSRLKYIGAKTELYLMRCGFHPDMPHTYRAMSTLPQRQQTSIHAAINHGIFKTNTNETPHCTAAK